MKPAKILWFLLCSLLMLFILQGDELKDNILSPGRKSHISHIQGLYHGSLPDTGFEAKLTYPYEAALREYIMTMDPVSRRIPAHRRLRAAREAIALKRLRKLKADDEAIRWNELAANTGGRARALMFDPTDPEHKKVWAGAVTGGLWYTEDITDTSEHWKPVDDFWESLAVGCICSDPNDPNTFYVGTGEGQTAFVTYRESSGTGAGIMHSKDAGKTWELMPSTTGFAYITDIQVRDEQGVSVIYVGTRSGDYKGKIFNSEPENGLYRSADGGQTWQQVLPKIPYYDDSYSVADIEITSSGRIFVGTTNNLDLKGGGRIMYSDDGLNWTIVYQFVQDILDDEIFNIPGRVMLASAPSDPDRIYAVFGSGAFGSNGILYIYSRFTARSDDGGETWIKGDVPLFRDDPSHAANWAYIAWHALTVAVDPEDPDIVYVGGCDLHRSVDGGISWKWISDTWEASLHIKNTCMYVHADHHAVVFQPGSRDLLVNVNDGGVFLTYNPRDSIPCWSERNEDFNTMQYYTCAIHPGKDVIHFLGGTQDNSTMLYDGKGPVTDDGNRYLGGDGAYCFVDGDEPDIHIISTQWNWYSFTDKLYDTLYDFPNMFRSGLFVNPADYDWRNNTLYANAVMQNGTYDNEIIKVSNIPRAPAGEFIDLGTDAGVPFSAIRLSPHSPSQEPVLFLGTQSGRLFEIHNPGRAESWYYEIGSMDFPSANISSIQVAGSEADLLVTFSNYGVSSVWITRDAGLTWEDREGNLPDIPVRWAIFHPANYNHVLLATEVGIWSNDSIWSDNIEWKPELEGLANVRVDMMQVRESDQLVLAATHGRGMYTGKWEVEADSSQISPGENEPVKMYPNPTRGEITIEYQQGTSTVIMVEVFDRTGRKVLTKMYYSFAGQFEKTLDLSDLASGTYICRISVGNDVSKHRIVLVRPE